MRALLFCSSQITQVCRSTLKAGPEKEGLFVLPVCQRANENPDAHALPEA
jgi:hypothetical protein